MKTVTTNDMSQPLSLAGLIETRDRAHQSANLARRSPCLWQGSLKLSSWQRAVATTTRRSPCLWQGSLKRAIGSSITFDAGRSPCLWQGSLKLQTSQNTTVLQRRSPCLWQGSLKPASFDKSALSVRSQPLSLAGLIETPAWIPLARLRIVAAPVSGRAH